MLTVALVALFVGLMTLAFATSRIELMIAGLLTGVGHGWAFPILLGLVVTRARSSERGAALAIYTALFDAGTLLGAPLWGAIIESISYPAMFCLAAGLIFLGGLINSVTADAAVTQSSGSSA